MASEPQIVSKIGGDKDELIVKLTKALRQQNYLFPKGRNRNMTQQSNKMLICKLALQTSTIRFFSFRCKNPKKIRIQKKILPQIQGCLDLKTQTMICQEEKLLRKSKVQQNLPNPMKLAKVRIPTKIITV
ncbi:MAG: hypothetical protein EZS28_044383 [Streblomastix strix]|uniref:Uncharacterized protein n=1 Tax=Streblomastix strix TaxID=222440 RepID=A0A5J4TQ90_9EUKA|nr:MAG: hypothetical protein EZS28_044383 [Streblomastix strix]